MAKKEKQFDTNTIIMVILALVVGYFFATSQGGQAGITPTPTPAPGLMGTPTPGPMATPTIALATPTPSSTPWQWDPFVVNFCTGGQYPTCGGACEAGMVCASYTHNMHYAGYDNECRCVVPEAAQAGAVTYCGYSEELHTCGGYCPSGQECAPGAWITECTCQYVLR